MTTFNGWVRQLRSSWISHAISFIGGLFVIAWISDVSYFGIPALIGYFGTNFLIYKWKANR